jgi:two-component system sensor histidine kinase/response regulator
MTSILIIEDEAILREEVAEWLTLEGYDASQAADGVEGLDFAFRRRPDLIICDIAMPRLDGYGVLLELHANPTTKNIPFIFMTARAAHEDIRQGMDLGADDYVTKPFTRLELLQAIQTRLQKKADQEQALQDEVDQWRRAFEEEHEYRLFKTRLVAMFSHDFRNPLASILSVSQLLRHYADRMDEEQRRSRLDRIDASVHQLEQMLDDMLVVAQMESGSIKYRPEAVNPGQFVQTIVHEFQSIHGEAYQLVFADHFAGTLLGDPRLLRQIATNLISNAIKYSPQGGEVRVTVADDDGQCHLIVQDQGIGIPEDDQARLFTAFQRGSNVADIPGTGLGLAIVKQAVDLHGGSIRLESQVGRGTTVTVTLPC